MCGIAGFTYKERGHDPRGGLGAMTNALHHRGPDAEGSWIDAGMALGHRRLSIIDLSQAAAQPMVDASGSYVLVFNGEIYNYREIKAELKDYPFEGSGDTEVILAAFRKWGKDCFARFNGMFALAIWDKKQEELLLVRDRLGIKPLYYHFGEQGLTFASEVRALLASGRVPAHLHTDSLAEYLQYYTINAPLTLIKDVSMLKAGEMLVWKKGQHRLKTYWSLGDQGGEPWEMSYQEVCKKNLDLLSEAVARRMISDVPLGAFLSGGIDSSAVVALMAQASQQPIHTFSVVFEEEEFDESPYSSMMAQKYGTSHHPIQLKPRDFLDQLPQALLAMDHPSGDGINSYMVSQATRREGFKVALSGLGGDELYAGYPVFRQYQKLKGMDRLYALPSGLRKVGAGVMGALAGGGKAGRLKQILSLDGPAFDQLYPIFHENFSPKERQQLLKTPDRPFSLGSVFSFEDLANISQYPIFSQVSVGEMATYTQNVLLRDTDQMSMAHSLEVRVPFFDHELVEFVLRIEDKHKEPHYPKKLLVDSLGDLLPQEVVFRKKMGFTLPWSLWMKNELRDFCESNLNSLGKRGIFQASYIDNLWKLFLQDKGGISWIKLWMLIVLEEWMEQHKILAHA